MAEYLLKNAQGEAVEMSGRQIKLTENENNVVNYIRKTAAMMTNNDLGVDAGITTLTAILKDLSQQKFFTVDNLSDYVPFNIGQGAWSSIITTYRTFEFGQGFDEGIIDVAAADGKLSSVDAGVDTINQKVYTWAKKIAFTLPELKQCAFTGVFDLQTAKAEALKKNWDLGIQEKVFLGSKTGKGLLNFKDVKTDTTTLTKPLSAMDATEFNTFVSTAPGIYRQTTNWTERADRFVIPEDDYLGLAGYTSPNYPLRTKLEVLSQAFKSAFGEGFKILPCAYANKDKNGRGGSTNIYALYKADSRSIRANVPVPFTMLQQSALNGFNFEAVATGQFADVTLLRPQELVYFTCNA